MPKARQRHELRRRSFDACAALYERARPDYPDELFADLVRLTGVGRGARVLEVGPGTGQATLPLARLGCSIIGLEPSSRMARRCRKNLDRFPAVTVVEKSFEEWRHETGRFDLVFAASSFHWVRPHLGFSRAAACLKPGGHLALCWNFRATPESELQAEMDRAYRELGLKPWHARPPAERIERVRRSIENSGRFGPTSVLTYDNERSYGTDEYLDLLRTMSDHAIMERNLRRRLFLKLRTAFRRHGGTYVRPATAVLFLALKRA